VGGGLRADCRCGVNRHPMATSEFQYRAGSSGL
jgi:hypothetical protein